MVDLSVCLGDIRMANPVMTASGTCGYAFELNDFVDVSALGGFITKSITLEERAGNPPQRTFETAAGMINAIGLANVGLERFCSEKVPLLDRMEIPVIVNVAGKGVDDYVAVSRRVAGLDCVAGLELNASCPNVKEGGITFGTDPCAISELVSAVRKACPETYLIVKLTPNVTDIAQMARAAVDAGADCLSLINTFVGLAIDVETRRPVLGNRTGGVSGPAIKPMAVYMVNRVYEAVGKPLGVPIIALGGIATANDALEFILAGASAVCVGTQMMIDPNCAMVIISGIEDYCRRHEVASVMELVGALE
ncbi:MAG: dihydroorotate dehydrogenase [Phycisphaerae bacterium]|nr:dihydroorotate dehydrogenase [Phycisphaerae bacterium]